MDCMAKGGMCEAHMDAGGPVEDRGADISKGFNGALGIKPKAMAEGGAVEQTPEAPEETEISEALGQELLTALEGKDSKQLMHSLEAIVLSCLNRYEE